MKLAMAQMAMSTDMAENLKKSLRFCEEAKGSDLLFFPESQLCPFFPQYEKKNVDAYCLRSDAQRSTPRQSPYLPQCQRGCTSR